MSKTTTIARTRRDGVLVRVNPEGTEEPLPIPPPTPMTEEEIEAAAWADPDARPFTPEERAKAKRVPRVKTLRRVLRLTQEEFAARYKIPLGTLRDWEQGRSEPDAPARAYLHVIARDPEGFGQWLQQQVALERPLPPINSIMSLAPGQERDEAWHLVTALFGLEQLSQAFHAAVELFGFSSSESQKLRDERKSDRFGASFDHRLWMTRMRMLSAWRQLAARDGALQIFHFGTVMGKIRGQLHNVPSIMPFVDSKKLRHATKSFSKNFPNYVLIRDAVAHSHYELAPNTADFSRQVPEETSIPGLVQAKGILVTHALMNDTFIITKDKIIASYEISERTYKMLEEVRGEFVSGFDNVRREAIKRSPNPPTT